MLFSTQSRTIQDIQDIQVDDVDDVDDVDFGDASPPPEPHLFFSLVFSFFSSLILARTKSNGLRQKKRVQVSKSLKNCLVNRRKDRLLVGECLNAVVFVRFFCNAKHQKICLAPRFTA
jgi:hypothetical protein